MYSKLFIFGFVVLLSHHTMKVNSLEVSSNITETKRIGVTSNSSPIASNNNWLILQKDSPSVAVFDDGKSNSKSNVYTFVCTTVNNKYRAKLIQNAIIRRS